MDPQKRQRSRPTTAPQRRPTHTKLTKKHSSWTMKDWFSNAPKQGYYHTKIFTSHTKTYLAICKNAVREANVIESNGSQRVLDISIQTMGGRTYTVIMYSSGHRNLVNRGRITFKTDRVRKLHDFEKVAGKVADKTYELKTRGKDVICTNYDMFEPESLKAGGYVAGGVAAVMTGDPGIAERALTGLAIGGLLSKLSAPMHVTIFFRSVAGPVALD